MRRLPFMCVFVLFIVSCGGGGSGEQATRDDDAVSAISSESKVSDYDPNRGEGKFTEVKLDRKLDAAMAARGEQASDLKCMACHKLTDEKLVGPGWKEVTKRNRPEWIMNFITNTDAMIDKDPKVQAMLELCMVRMPNQNLTDEEARDILEFMRKNDGIK